jgi:hypothetical protein
MDSEIKQMCQQKITTVMLGCECSSLERPQRLSQTPKYRRSS